MQPNLKIAYSKSQSKSSKLHSLRSFFYQALTNLKFWIILWSLMFIYFLVIDLLNLFFGESLISPSLLNSASLVKISTILTCFLYASFFAPRDCLLRCALLFTFLADLILLSNNISPVGVAVFCLAQYFHTARYANLNSRFFIGWTFFIVLSLAFTKIYQIPLIYGAAFIYANTLLLNFFLARQWLKRKVPESRRAAICNFIGFILFICCDLTVLISFFSRSHFLPDFLYTPANFICWLFYFPSQVLLTNSSVLTAPYYAPFDAKLKELGTKSKFIEHL